ncbi:unnamed protein product, partial [Mesorhabditis spiculigera]
MESVGPEPDHDEQQPESEDEVIPDPPTPPETMDWLREALAHYKASKAGETIGVELNASNLLEAFLAENHEQLVDLGISAELPEVVPIANPRRASRNRKRKKPTTYLYDQNRPPRTLNYIPPGVDIDNYDSAPLKNPRFLGIDGLFYINYEDYEWDVEHMPRRKSKVRHTFLFDVEPTPNDPSMDTSAYCHDSQQTSYLTESIPTPESLVSESSEESSSSGDEERQRAANTREWVRKTNRINYEMKKLKKTLEKNRRKVEKKSRKREERAKKRASNQAWLERFEHLHNKFEAKVRPRAMSDSVVLPGIPGTTKAEAVKIKRKLVNPTSTLADWKKEHKLKALKKAQIKPEIPDVKPQPGMNNPSKKIFV